jgi:hypothetical protein
MNLREPRLARFTYFYYYLGLFPVALEPPRADVEYSRAGALRLMTDHGNDLVMESGHAIRYGDLGRILLYLPDVHLKGKPENPSVRRCNSGAFVLGLLALFVAFWWVRQPILGALLVLLLGSNPFQLFEVYVNENVFGWPITACLFLLALHVPLLSGRRCSPWYLWTLPVLSGLLMATVRQVRSEPACVILSAVFSYLAAGGLRWRIRLALAAVLVLSFSVISKGWLAYFDGKFEQAARRVAAAGGRVFTGPRDHYHAFWHAVWCGLGDFGGKYGYEWGDMAAAEYALPILEHRYGSEVLRKYGTELPDFEAGTQGRTRRYTWGWWDSESPMPLYDRAHSDIPHYAEVLREKVLGDISRDPVWYLGVLVRRVGRVLSDTTPVRVSLGQACFTLPMHGALLIPVVGLLLWCRSWMLLKLVCFSLPLSLTAVLIYSGGGTCYYSCYHIFVAAALCAGLLELGVLVFRKRVLPVSWRRRLSVAPPRRACIPARGIGN